MARAQGAEVLWDGTNLDDLGDFRPGLQAARELGVASPLLEAGLDKAAIRDLSRALGLPWQKPAQSCLATRFPYGTLLTREALERVGQGEAWLLRRGFSHVRLRRPAAGVARLELNPEEWPVFLAPEVRGPFYRPGVGAWDSTACPWICLGDQCGQPPPAVPGRRGRLPTFLRHLCQKNPSLGPPFRGSGQHVGRGGAPGPGD